jgi:hypothetical protein
MAEAAGRVVQADRVGCGSAVGRVGPDEIVVSRQRSMTVRASAMGVLVRSIDESAPSARSPMPARMACDAAILPSERRLLEATDETALDEAYSPERHLSTSPEPAPATTSSSPATLASPSFFSTWPTELAGDREGHEVVVPPPPAPPLIEPGYPLASRC